MNITKRIAVLVLLVFAGTGLYAQESGFRSFFSGGGPTATLYGLGGKGEIAFLFHDRGLQISAHLVGRGASVTINSDNHGAGTLGAKISFGGLWPSGRFRSYAFVEGGFGVAGGNYGALLAGLFGGGGGLDWLFSETASLYIELGYLQHHVSNRFAGSPSITIGARRFF